MTTGSSIQAMIFTAPFALFAFTDIDAEHLLESPGPGHGNLPLHRRAVVGFSGLCCYFSCPFATLGRGDGDAKLAVGGEHPMKVSQVHSGLGHQGSKPCHKVQRFEDYMSGAIVVRSA